MTSHERLIEWDAVRPKPRRRCDGDGDCPNCQEDDDE